MLLFLVPPLLAELGMLVPSVEGTNFHLHSTSLAFWEGDRPLAWDHYEILWAAINKMPS
jgi:hypothetical protein